MVYYRFSRYWKDGKNGTGIQRRTRVRSERIPKWPAKNPWSWTAPWAGLSPRPVGCGTNRTPSAPRIAIDTRSTYIQTLKWSCRTEWFLCPVFLCQNMQNRAIEEKFIEMNSHLAQLYWKCRKSAKPAGNSLPTAGNTDFKMVFGGDLRPILTFATEVDIS